MIKPISLLLKGIESVPKWGTLDFMEYSSDANAQAAYVTNGEIIDQENTTADGGGNGYLGDGSNNEYRQAQSFILSGAITVTAVEMKCASVTGSPSGNWTFRIETNNAGVPSGTLANANASIVVTPPTAGNSVKGTFATPFALSASTTYWLVVQCDNQATDQRWVILAHGTSVYANGVKAASANGTWAAQTADCWFKVYTQGNLLAYSESTIKTQGSYSLKAVASTSSLNKTLTRTVSPTIDLSGQTKVKFDIRSNRTGSNVKVGIHDAGGTTTETTPNITSADTFQTCEIDISGVADSDKNSIDQIQFTVLNADSPNTFYLDYMRYR